MNLFLTRYNWSDFFNKVSEFGATFVNEEKCIESSKLRGDTHTIIHRLTKQEIPQWIKDVVPEEIIVLQIFAIEPNTVGLVHKDGVDRLCAFNIPILNCNLGSMDWFNENEYSSYPVGNDYTTIRVSNEQIKDGKVFETTPSFSTIVDTPSLVNTNAWHRVDNRNSDKFRWMLSLRFVNNPSYNTVKEKFNNAFK
jgi:hypothetical protein